MSRFQRRHSFRKPKKFFIVATEGECTEEIYFTALRPPREATVQIKLLPARKGKSHPRSVLERLKSYEREAGSGEDDELWLVVDRDEWTADDLDKVAAVVAQAPKYRLALSNPCFELWLVLHFRQVGDLNRKQLQRLLREELGAYEKNDYDAEALKRTVEDAIDRAQRMDTPPQEPWPRQPGTHVYRLVKRLLAR